MLSTGEASDFSNLTLLPGSLVDRARFGQESFIRSSPLQESGAYRFFSETQRLSKTTAECKKIKSKV